MRLFILFGIFIFDLTLVQAQEAKPTDNPSATSLIDVRLQALEKEVSLLKEQNDVQLQTARFAEAQGSYSGLGPSASKIYFHKESEFTLGLSSEFIAFRERRGAETNRLNVTSVAPTIGYWLHRRVVFNAQLMFENGGAESSDTVTVREGQAIVYMAYLDWLGGQSKNIGVRFGHQLIPIGTTNTSSEPTTYFGVLRPPLERELIPAHWHENGINFWADRERVAMQAGVFNSLDASQFRKDSFLSGGRANGQNAAAENLMGVLRIDVKGGWLSGGVSTAFGNSTQKTNGVGRGTFQLTEFHTSLRLSPLKVSYMLAQGILEDADSISLMNSTVVGSRSKGHSVEVASELPLRKNELWAFARQSRYDLHDRVPDGFARDLTLHKEILTFGLHYLPLKQIVIKADYSFMKNALSDEDDEYALSAGLSF